MKKTLATALALLLAASAARPEEGKTLTTASGLTIEVLTPGKAGTRPTPGDRVTVHYTGCLTDGKKFDSSVDRNEPFSFTLGAGEVIKGWDEGVALMDVGSKVRLTIPPAIAYGAEGRPPVIPPSATLVFEIELLGVVRGIAFRAPTPEKQTRTESGLLYEVLVEGAGDPPRADQGVSLRFAMFTKQGKPLVSSVGIGQNIAGLVPNLRLGRFALKFLPEAARLMKPGSTVLFEVPATLAFGDKAMSPDLPGGSVTVWVLELAKVNDLPAFAAPEGSEAKVTASGLKYVVLREGTGKTPAADDTVKVHYTGWLLDGTAFDSSHARGEPISFPLDGVIAGWTEGVALMREGAIFRFEIPAALAYGSKPPPGSAIPADAPLVFVVELISIE